MTACPPGRLYSRTGWPDRWSESGGISLGSSGGVSRIVDLLLDGRQTMGVFLRAPKSGRDSTTYVRPRPRALRAGEADRRDLEGELPLEGLSNLLVAALEDGETS
jgi:hypothetical protein